MVERICSHIHNFFTSEDDKHTGTYTIEGGSITLPFLINGQYFRIEGSTLNDGVYQYPADGLSAETFTGTIWAMKVPVALIKIAQEAEALESKSGAAVNGPYTSENVIGAYSYSKAANASGGVDSWLFGADGVFGKRLNRWRRLSE